MRLNGAANNASRLNAAGVLFPKALAGDSVGVVTSELTGVRYALGYSDAISAVIADLDGRMQQFFDADLTSLFTSDIAASATRAGQAEAVASTFGGLYYTRLVYGNGSADVAIIAISDVGVVYGAGSGVVAQLADLTGARMRTGFGDAMATSVGELSPSAIRVPGTSSDVPLIPWLGALDSATILAGGVRRIDASGEAFAYLDLIDNGMKRQVFIGSLDLAPDASGFGTAIRNMQIADAIVITTAVADFEARRTAAGDAVAIVSASMDSDILVLGEGEAVVQITSAMSAQVTRLGGVIEAIGTLTAELNAYRARMGAGEAPVAVVVTGYGARGVVGDLAPLTTFINSTSVAGDYDVSSLDDDAEIFYRPAPVREFVKPAYIRELRR